MAVRTAAANVAADPNSGGPVHRQLVPVGAVATTRRSNGREAVELEQVRARVAALLTSVVGVGLHLHDRNSAAAGDGRGHRDLAVDVQEPDGPAPARPRPRRGGGGGGGARRLGVAGAARVRRRRRRWRRRARGLRVVRRTRRALRGWTLAGEDGVEQAGEPRAGRRRPAARAGRGGARLRLRRLLHIRLLMPLLPRDRRAVSRATGGGGADGAEPAKRVLHLGRREVAPPGAIRRGTQRRRRPVAGGQRRLVAVVVVVAVRRLLPLLGRRTRRVSCPAVLAALVHGVADGVEQRRRERRLVRRPPPRPPPPPRRRRRRRPPHLHVAHGAETEQNAMAMAMAMAMARVIRFDGGVEWSGEWSGGRACGGGRGDLVAGGRGAGPAPSRCRARDRCLSVLPFHASCSFHLSTSPSHSHSLGGRFIC